MRRVNEKEIRILEDQVSIAICDDTDTYLNNIIKLRSKFLNRKVMKQHRDIEKTHHLTPI